MDDGRKPANCPRFGAEKRKSPAPPEGAGHSQGEQRLLVIGIDGAVPIASDFARGPWTAGTPWTLSSSRAVPVPRPLHRPSCLGDRSSSPKPRGSSEGVRERYDSPIKGQ